MTPSPPLLATFNRWFYRRPCYTMRLSQLVHGGIAMTAKHSAPVRGLMSAGRSPSFEGLFGRMFRALPPANFGKTEDDNTTNLSALGIAMSGSAEDVAKDGKDDEESGIPALYTYFGQFVDHDITFDPAS